MSDALFNDFLTEVDSFSFEQCAIILSRISNRLRTSKDVNTFKRHAGMAKDPNFFMASDFDEPLEEFKEYM